MSDFTPLKTLPGTFGKKSAPEMTDEEFRSIKGLIYGHCGLFFDDDKKYFLQKRLSRRLSVLQLPTFKDYFLFLKYDRHSDEELSFVVDLLTTNETYFFREGYQLKAFTDEIIPEIEERKNEKSLRIWSAGCSTGEEPFTIAILLLELIERGRLNGWQIEILGSDISQRVLGVARRGLYGATSFRGADEKYLTYFEQEGDKKRVMDEVRKIVTFTHLNLLEGNRINLLRSMDVIFCRNVLIYFDLAAKRKVVDNFYGKLKDGGCLLLGHSESLMNVSTRFVLKHLKNDMVYQKPLRHG
jgi:chemotaxis protein methyltransferase CheR